VAPTATTVGALCCCEHDLTSFMIYDYNCARLQNIVTQHNIVYNLM
jgi:hypothetical protein